MYIGLLIVGKILHITVLAANFKMDFHLCIHFSKNVCMYIAVELKCILLCIEYYLNFYFFKQIFKQNSSKNIALMSYKMEIKYSTYIHFLLILKPAAISNHIPIFSKINNIY